MYKLIYHPATETAKTPMYTISINANHFGKEDTESFAEALNEFENDRQCFNETGETSCDCGDTCTK